MHPRSSKAFYRSALALLALDRPDEALDSCQRCLAFDANNSVVKTLRDRASKAKLAKEEKERKRVEAIRREQEERLRIREAFKASPLPHFRMSVVQCISMT